MPTADYSSYHQPNTTTSDGSKFDNFIDAVQATVNALDNNNVAASAGIVASKLADPTTGKVLGSSGAACAAVYPPGYELAYVELTGGVSITATTDATADNVVSSGAVTYDGTAVWVEFYCPFVVSSAGQTVVTLYDNTAGASLGRILQPAASTQLPGLARRRFTPAAGSRTYSIRAFVGSGTGTIGAGAGGAGVSMPAYVRITKA